MSSDMNVESMQDSNKIIYNETEAERNRERERLLETEIESDQWSLRVRLISAVDLPPSIVPSVPLCPFFKFGLITESEADSASTSASTSASSCTSICNSSNSSQ